MADTLAACASYFGFVVDFLKGVYFPWLGLSAFDFFRSVLAVGIVFGILHFVFGIGVKTAKGYAVSRFEQLRSKRSKDSQGLE